MNQTKELMRLPAGFVTNACDLAGAAAYAASMFGR
jgi:hypothetical protein